MTTPPLRKWRIPRPMFERHRCGWNFIVYLNPDHNPVLVISHSGIWYFEFWERYTWRSDTGWHIWPKFH